MTPTPDGPLVIHPKPAKYVLPFSLAGLGVLIGLARGGTTLMFLCLAAIAVIYAQLKTSWIALDAQGFTVKMFWRRDTYKWTDINPEKGFYVVTHRVNFIPVNRYVAWNFSPHYRKGNRIVRFTSRVFRRAEALIPPLGNDARSLAVVMTAFLRKAQVPGASR